MDIKEDKLYFIDFETGGLDHEINPACDVTLKKYNGNSKTFVFAPHNMMYNIEALNINGYDIGKLKELGTTKYDFIGYFDYECLKKSYIILCGYNVEFDMKYLYSIYNKMQVSLPCAIVYLDLMKIANDNIKDTEIESYSLSCVCKYFFDDYDKDKAHTSSYDVEMTEKLYNKFKTLNYI